MRKPTDDLMQMFERLAVPTWLRDEMAQSIRDMQAEAWVEGVRYAGRLPTIGDNPYAGPVEGWKY